MIIECIHQRRKSVAGALAWFLAAQITLPVFANTSNDGNRITYSYAGAGARPKISPNLISSSGIEQRDIANALAKKRRQEASLPKTELILKSSGPSQPEMSSFKSVGTENMVDPFSGDFSYNIPLLDVGGYPVSIHYNSKITMDQEASWVGLGWNINPGTIARNMRGLPDDFNGVDSISKTVSIKPNINLGVNGGLGVEFLGFPIGYNAGISYNSYKGYGMEGGVSISSPISKAAQASGGNLNGSLSLSNSSMDGASVGAGIGLSYSSTIQDKKISTEYGLSTELKGSLNYNSRAGLTSLSIDANKSAQSKSDAGATSFGIPASLSFARPTYIPGTEIPYTTLNTSFNVKFGASFFTVYANANVGAQLSVQFIAPGDMTKYYPAYGYLNYSSATLSGDKNALLDYNRDNDGVFIDKITPAIAIPNYTYDVYTISAEGTGGSFRPYRSDIGYMYSTYNKTNSGQLNVGMDLGIKHFGKNIKPVYSNTITRAWLNDNKLKNFIGFQQKDSTFEDVVFRNPMEMPVQSESFLLAIARDTLIRPVLEGRGINATLSNSFALMPNGINTVRNIQIKSKILKDKREKRNQVISYLTAGEAALYGLDKKIYSYKNGFIPYTYCSGGIDSIERVDNGLRKTHHLSEVTVLNEDGRRYVYGIPAYTISQKNITFAVKSSNPDTDKGLTSYTSTEASTQNKSGVDGYFSSETIPGYAHSFLLSGILSTDYIDITGNGISDDDAGEAVKFNYTRIYGPSNAFGWRAPSDANKASFNQGLKTYNRDDKANIVYGSKEVWYLNSIVSKNMVAVFSTDSDRIDAMSQQGISGSVESAKQLRRLKRIDLYTKADLVSSTNGGKLPRPVKSVWFEYDSSLCRGVNNNYISAKNGKLTLKKIWFTYNGNNGKKSNPYVFNYNGLNPSYQPKHSDAWGNYKDPTTNPGGLNNQEYPYVVQDNLNAVNQNAAAWSLTDITLPSKGAIKVTYEADDYGFVQNRKAMQLYKIVGLGRSPYENPVSKIYLKGATPFNYIFIDVPEPVYSKADVYSKYLEGIKSLYIKFFISVPGDRWGSGSEFVPMICELDSDYGYVSDYRIFVKIKEAKNSSNKSVLEHYALQFLKENLSSKAYPGSETGDDPDLKSVVNMIGSQTRNIIEMVTGFDDLAESAGTCQNFTPSRSFIKLNNPTMFKKGGGLRVKSVKVFDNFYTLTGTMKDAVYGQEYDYTTSASIVDHGSSKRITISSGVATFEPFIGGEENALKGYYAYREQLNKLGPVAYKYVDTPFCSVLYPAASVGYSKVTVRTINKLYQSANGKEVYSYYTYKDFPTSWSFTPFDNDSRKRHQPPIANILKLNAQHYLTLSQGFKVELNDMHGKLRSHAFYSESDSVNPISYTENIYRTKTVPGQAVSLDNIVWATDGAEAPINTKAAMGQGVEIMADLREQTGITGSVNVELNLDVVFIPPFAVLGFPSVWPWPQFERTRFRSASILKVINNYGILDSVYQVDKGTAVSTKNLVYDKESGNVLLTRTNNEFKDPIYSFNYPASWAYSGMGMAYKNIHVEFGRTTAVNIKNGRIYDLANNALPMERYFESGDECVVSGSLSSTNIVGDADCSFVYGATNTYVPQSKKVWVLNAKKGTSETPLLFLIDENGKPVNAIGTSIKVLRSGKRNLTGSSAGTVTMLNSPLVNSFGNLIIKIDSTRKIINANANSYRDCWKTENSYFAKDTTVVIASVQKQLDIYATPSMLASRQQKISSFDITSYNASSPYAVASKDWIEYCSGDHTTYYNTKGILHFDLPTSLAAATINAAFINLSPRVPTSLWASEHYGCGLGSSHYNLNWANQTTWQYGTHLGMIRRMTGSYSPSTSYLNLSTVTTNQVSLSNLSTDFSRKTIDATNLIKDLITNPAGNNNLAIEVTGSANTTYVSFASKYEQTNLQFPSPTTYPGVARDKSGYMFFEAPSLTLKYTTAQDSTYTLCKQRLSDTTNPYRWGIYGNWRPDRSVVFYDTRVEIDPSIPTNTRINGTLNNFIPYWNTVALNNTITPASDTMRWVWTSASTLTNSRGAEIESVDALGRYSSGQYGYNNNLPVSVVQNSMYRQSVFDGFEDYQYKDQYCNNLCSNPRFADFTKFTLGTAALTTAAAHTGLYSLSVASNSTVRLEFKLYDSTNDPANKIFPCVNCGTKSKIDSTRLMDTVITAAGLGMIRSISGAGVNCASQTNPVSYYPYQYPSSCYPSGTSTAPANYTIQWSGFIQIPQTGKYDFSMSASGVSSTTITINNTSVVTGMQLQKTTMVPVTIFAFVNSRYPVINLQWSNDQGLALTNVNSSNQYRYISDTAGTTKVNFKKWCVRMNRPSANVDTFLTNPLFSPIKRTGRFIVSAWMKDSQPCEGVSTISASIRVSFDQGSTGSWVLLPTGVAVDGWQRVEVTVDSIPKAATKLKIEFFNAGSQVFIDDIRIHPFNANMKSYVYNPLNLRLMAELDENNYASFYEYDDDGTLIRVKKETEKGIKTIKETRSALAKTQGAVE